MGLGLCLTPIHYNTLSCSLTFLWGRYYCPCFTDDGTDISMTCPRLCRVSAKELVFKSGLFGSRVHAFDHCPIFLSKDIHPGYRRMYIHLLLIQCRIEPSFLNRSFVAEPQCALAGCSLRKSSPVLSHGGHIISSESWLAALSTSR